MIVNHINSNQTSTYNLDNSLEKWVLDEGVTIESSSDNALFQSSNFHNDIVQINGTITSTATNFQAVQIKGSITDVIVGETGSLTGYVGVSFYETKHDSFVNHGTVSATGPVPTAISIGYSTNLQVENDGTLNGCIYVFGSDKIDIQLDKGGKVFGAAGTPALNIANDEGARTTVVNDGLVQGDSSGAISGRDGIERVINHGKIVGGVSLDAGNDYFDTRDGKFTGNIFMGDGNDTVLISKSSTYIDEDAGEGKDTVKADCNYTLASGSEIEILRLLGKANFRASGNEFDNHLFGNTGNNKLAGFAGTDLLTGGKGADTFIFADGYGADTVTDFHAGTDHIDLSALTEVTGFKDLMQHHVSVSGGDLTITAGTDTLVLEHTTKAALHASDFIF